VATTFQGGQAVPAVGTAAYAAAQGNNPNQQVTTTGNGATKVINQQLPATPSGYSYNPTAGTFNSPQSFDSNGNPTSTPTVVSDANVRESVIPGIQSKAASYSPGGINGPQPVVPGGGITTGQGGTTSGIVPSGSSYTPSNPSGNTDNGSGGGNTSDTSDNGSFNYEDALNSALNGENQQPLDPATQQAFDTLSQLKTTSDALTASQISSIQSSYSAKAAFLSSAQAAQTSALQGKLGLAGSSRYAPVSTSGIMSLETVANVQQLVNLTMEENGALLGVYQAQEQMDFNLASKQLDELDSLRDEKITLATKMADAAQTEYEDAVQQSLDQEKINQTQEQITEQTKMDSITAAQDKIDDNLKQQGIDLQAGQLKLSQQQLYFSEGLNPDGSVPEDSTSGSAATFDTTGDLVDSSGNIIASASDLKTSYGITTLANGVTYADSSSAPFTTGTDGMKTRTLNAVRAMGIPILSAQQANVAQGLATAIQQLTTLEGMEGKGADPTAIVALGQNAPAKDTAAALKDTLDKLATLDPTLASLGSGSLPSTFFTTQSNSAINSKLLTNLNSALGNIVGISNVPATGFVDPTAYQAASPNNAATFASTASALKNSIGRNPTPAEVMQAINFASQ
jgi:hypothetical protein